MPNKNILISALTLNEAKNSSEIENIITTHDELFKALVLKNDKTGEVIYTPPGNEKTIRNLMKNLEDYINEKSNVDPLIKMAVAHYQFEAIHPFYDGNGRTGRIINILHLVMNNLLDSPILYLSKYILNNRSEYYKTLQNITENNDWESWIIYVLKGIQKTSKDSIQLLKKINSLLIEQLK